MNVFVSINSFGTFPPCTKLRSEVEICTSNCLLEFLPTPSTCIWSDCFSDSIEDCYFGDDDPLDIIDSFIDWATESAFFDCSWSNKLNVLHLNWFPIGFSMVQKRLIGHVIINTLILAILKAIFDFQRSPKGLVPSHLCLWLIIRWLMKLSVNTSCVTMFTHVIIRNGVTSLEENVVENGEWLPVSFRSASNFRPCVVLNTNEFVCSSVETKISNSHVKYLETTDQSLSCQLVEHD